MKFFLQSGVYALTYGLFVAFLWRTTDWLAGFSPSDFFTVAFAAMSGAWMPINLLLENSKVLNTAS